MLSETSERQRNSNSLSYPLMEKSLFKVTEEISFDWMESEGWMPRTTVHFNDRSRINKGEDEGNNRTRFDICFSACAEEEEREENRPGKNDPWICLSWIYLENEEFYSIIYQCEVTCRVRWCLSPNVSQRIWQSMSMSVSLLIVMEILVLLRSFEDTADDKRHDEHE